MRVSASQSRKWREPWTFSQAPAAAAVASFWSIDIVSQPRIVAAVLYTAELSREADHTTSVTIMSLSRILNTHVPVVPGTFPPFTYGPVFLRGLLGPDPRHTAAPIPLLANAVIGGRKDWLDPALVFSNYRASKVHSS